MKDAVFVSEFLICMKEITKINLIFKNSRCINLPYNSNCKVLFSYIFLVEMFGFKHVSFRGQAGWE